MSRGPDMEGFDTDGFECPRCATVSSEDFYGPCSSCRSELNTIYAGSARSVEAAAYEPKMNVTPNAVAVKD
jgi:hypothetical protein